MRKRQRRPAFERWHDAAEGTRSLAAVLGLVLSGSILGEAVFGPGSTQRPVRLVLAAGIFAAFAAGPLLHWAGRRSYERSRRKAQAAVIQLRQRRRPPGGP